ncbi:MAG: TetR/AcrR family transcriptional regulator, partial [Burkholderiales bacterium]|nr:TetR/AcrR family transcriptional regulator [Burkholderiales bacterium]
ALRRRGYHGAALNDVVAESGAPRGSLYHHFPEGKDAIGAAAVRLVGVGVTRALAPRGSVAPGGREAIGVIASQLSEGLQRSGFDEGCPVVGAAMGLGPETPLTREACAEAFGAWTDALAAVYREGGVEASRAVPLARLSIAALEGAVGLCRAQRSIEPMRQVAAELGALLDGAHARRAAPPASPSSPSSPSSTAPTAPTAPSAARRPRRAR